MLEKLKICPFCSSPDIEPFLEARDYTVSRETFSLSNCKSCGLIFTNPRPDTASISKYYESKDYISHTNSKKGIFNRVYQQVRKFTIKHKFSIINRFTSKKNNTLLDIGCGTGEFLFYCKQQGYSCTGIEPSLSARNQVMSNYGLTVYDTPELSVLPSASFDIITLWHVLEHVHDLRATIENLNRLLKPGGYCFIAVPNLTSFDANKYDAYWAAYDVPRHLFHFSPAALKNTFQSFDFEHVKSLPMKLDSYYVSLLSEKYKTGLGLFSIINSLITGFISNLKAQNAEQYSSVIYAFRKKTI